MDQEELDAIKELKSMSREELDQVPYDVVKWCCQGKNCTRGTKVRDYGIAPTYFWPRKNKEWLDISPMGWFFMCGKHNKLWKRLKKNFTEEHIYNKLFDFSKTKITEL